MTYGSMHQSTRNYVEKCAQVSNIDLSKLGLEPCMDIHEPVEDILLYCIKPRHEANEEHVFKFLGEVAIYQITVICDGALDEEFLMADTIYEVNLADWLAEQCREAMRHDDIENFEIIVSEYVEEDAGAVRYRVSDETDG